MTTETLSYGDSIVTTLDPRGWSTSGTATVDYQSTNAPGNLDAGDFASIHRKAWMSGGFLKGTSLVGWQLDRKLPDIGWKVGFPCAFPIVDVTLLAGITHYFIDLATEWSDKALDKKGGWGWRAQSVFRPIGANEVILFMDDFPVGTRVSVSLSGYAPRTFGDCRLLTDDATEAEVRRIFRTAEEEDFEDGAEGEFQHALASVVKRQGPLAVTAIRELIARESGSNLVSAEALECLANIEDVSTHQIRLGVLQEALRSSSIVIRDAAILGLVHLDDIDAAPSLEQAKNEETCPELREDIEYLLARLRRQN